MVKNIDLLKEFEKHKNWTLYHSHPVYGDDDDQDEYWAVNRESGSINDREFTDIGKGQTPEEAIRNALTYTD